jgi:hypothetical protein
MIYLLQSGEWMSKERGAVLRTDLPRTSCSYEDLSTLLPDSYIPIGTVEYVRRYCELNQIQLPANISYPTELAKYLKREMYQTTFERAPDHFFVKPISTKVFTGAVKRQLIETVSDSEPVWCSEPIDLTSEYRYYIIDKSVVGYSRYDDSDLEDAEPDIEYVEQMVADYANQPVGYTLDIGMSAGEPVLIEANDGWSLGLYPWGTMQAGRYVELITRRWQQILELNDERTN